MSNPGSVEIVVHAVRTVEISKRKSYEYGEVYRVNLDTKKISKCPGKLYLDDTFTSMVNSGDFIYIIGGDEHSKPILDFRNRYLSVPCVAFKGNLFAFGGYYQEGGGKTIVGSDGEELCLTSKPLDGWRLLPSPPPPPPPETIDVEYQCRSIYDVSKPVIVDSKNNRILVHYPFISSLYAYYPDDREWEFLFIIKWHRLVAHHYPGCFQAFDLKTGTQLDDPVIPNNFPCRHLYDKFEAFIPLAPPGTFCLATNSSQFDVPYLTHLIFLKFRVVRNPSRKPHIIFISLHQLELDCWTHVTDYVPIVTSEDVVVSSKNGKVVIPAEVERGAQALKSRGGISFGSIGDIGI